MLPHAYELPAAILLVLGGALAWSAGYRLFRVVLAIYGFIFGAMLASSVMGISNTGGMVVAGLVGGLVGAAILTFAYFVGIALVGAGLGAFVVDVGWSRWAAGDPPAMLVIGLSIAGAVGALLLQRYVIIVGTAFGGAWTMIVGGLAVAGERSAARALTSADIWILYPLAPQPGQGWIPITWIALGAIGVAVQLRVTGRKR
jgi:uncharacterized protein DUF4203